MKYYIDFSSWVVESENEEEAFKKARFYLSKGFIPQINACSDEAEHDDFDEEVIETEDLYDVTGKENEVKDEK
ncbi:MAG: hypothetical protein DRP08_07905 [Candidatus Aenigmatarchaeota archaeon]|nr:MAG: hypothetical protein DRP08_07905 [Candidatus Aenigmarchaeota archaeon]